MKKLLSSALIAIFAIVQVWASEIPKGITANTMVESVWATQTKGSQATIYYDFQDNGVVDIIRQSKDGKISWNTMYWMMKEAENGQNTLHFQSRKGSESLAYQVERLQDHIVLKGRTLSAVLSTVSNENLDVVQSDLHGKWKSSFYDSKTGDMATSETRVKHMWKIGFQFNEDGTFVRHIQEGKNASQEVGVWDLSNDGQFVKLHFAKGGNIEQIYKKEILRIEDFRQRSMRVAADSNRQRDTLEIEDFLLHKK